MKRHERCSCPPPCVAAKLTYSNMLRINTHPPLPIATVAGLHCNKIGPYDKSHERAFPQNFPAETRDRKPQLSQRQSIVSPARHGRPVKRKRRDGLFLCLGVVDRFKTTGNRADAKCCCLVFLSVASLRHGHVRPRSGDREDFQPFELETARDLFRWTYQVMHPNQKKKRTKKGR